MRYISIKGVILGTTLGLLLDSLIGIVLTIVLGADAFAPGASEREMRRALAEIAHSTPFLLAGGVLGSLSTVASGYIGARIAGRLPYMNAAAVGGRRPGAVRPLRRWNAAAVVQPVRLRIDLAARARRGTSGEAAAGYDQGLTHARVTRSNGARQVAGGMLDSYR